MYLESLNYRTMRFFLLLVICFLIVQFTNAQIGKKSYEDQFDQIYEQNIKKDRIDGRYIPKDVNDAHKTLDRIMEPNVKDYIKSLPDSIAALKVINSIGPYLMKNWSLYEGSRLGHYLKFQKGLHHPLDMSFYLLQTYHHYLNSDEFSEESLLKYLIDRRRKIFEETVKDTTLDTLIIDKE